MTPHTTIILPDVHVPFHDANLVAKVCKLIRDIKPQCLVLSGDFMDLFTLSRHAAGSIAKLRGLTLSQEYRAGREVITGIAAGAKHSAAGAMHYLYGNHEDRYLRFMADGDAGKLGEELTSPEDGLRIRDLFHVHTDWQNDSIQIGAHLEVIHGTYLNDHAAKKHLDNFAGSVVFGHSHRFQTYVNGKRGAYNIGFLGDRDSIGFSYAPRWTRSKWVNGFAVVYTMDNGDFLVNAVQCWGGKFVFNGRVY